MLRIYFKLAYKNLVKNKVYSIINIMGLAVGLTCCILISVYVFQEYHYDTHHQKGDRIFQVGNVWDPEGRPVLFATTSAPMAPTLQKEIPEVESFTRVMKLFQDDKTLLQYQSPQRTVSFYEPHGFMADSTFFRLFSYEFTEGDAATALNRPNDAVISTDVAQRLFGNEKALGKIIRVNSSTIGEGKYRVSGVFAPSDVPSHINAHFFLSLQSSGVGRWVRTETNMLNNTLFYSYLLLRPGISYRSMEPKLQAFHKKYLQDIQQKEGRPRENFLIPLKDIHLHGNTINNITPHGSVKYLYVLMSIAFLTLLMACVNFVNLSTARSSARAVEIGIRKLLGEGKGALVRQLLLEAIILSLLSFAIACVLAWLLIPALERSLNIRLALKAEWYLQLFFIFLGITVVSGFISGLYPALTFAAFKPLPVLKGQFRPPHKALSFRKVLVVFQFVTSVALIVSSLSISRQIDFLRNKDLGFIKERQVILPLRSSKAQEIYPALKTSLSASPAFSGTGASVFYPGIENVTDWFMRREGASLDDHRTVFMNFVDESFLTTLGMQCVAGRLFSSNFPQDTANGIILNEQAVSDFGFSSPQEAIGKRLVTSPAGKPVYYPIVGVVRNFHFKALRHAIQPYGFLLRKRSAYSYVVAHVKEGKMDEAKAVLAESWGRLNPSEPLDYSFLDEDFQKNYEPEERFVSIIHYYTLIAILISCLGLFGLTSFTIEQRTREIGIRKVLGASAGGIVVLLSKGFMKLVLVSLVIASPLAWYFVKEWLEDFAYRVPMSVYTIVLGWVIALAISLLTISLQALRVAFANPVRSIRNE
jgi:putative ABC transport system permease protein